MWGLPSLANEWMGWIVVIGALAALAGVSGIVKPIAAVIEAITPAIKAIVEAVVGAAGWLWSTILRPGLRDIFDDWVTIATVAIVGGMLYWGTYTYMDQRMDRVVDQLSTCQNEITKLEKRYKVKKQPDWFWPLW